MDYMDVVVDVPTNLGLKPPVAGSVPGADKAPAALRAVGLHEHLLTTGWREGGVVLAGRYVPEHQSGTVRNQTAIIDHATRLAERLGHAMTGGDRPLVLGGDCSTLLGVALNLRRRGRYGLIHIDGHTDLLHPGNSTNVANLAGEDLAAACGLHYPQLSNIDGLAPYVDPRDAIHIGCRLEDEHLDECRSRLRAVVTASEWNHSADAVKSAVQSLTADGDLDGYWVHVDVDVLDPSFLPAVDSPDPGGVSPQVLSALLRQLWPGAAGMTVGILDPDLDRDTRYAQLVAHIVIEAVAS
jgi:arginase